MPRLIAPFDPDFRQVPADVLAKYFGYFQQMGWGVRSLSPSYVGGALTFSGSLQPDTGSWAVRADLPAAKVAGEVAQLAKAGMRPREVNVARKNGEPRHTIVFGSVSKGEAGDYVPARSEDAYVAAWNEQNKAPQPMRLVDSELAKLGHVVGKDTGARYMPRRRPRSRPPFQTWGTFIRNDLPGTLAIDFLTVPTATFGVLYVFVVLSLERRRVR